VSDEKAREHDLQLFRRDYFSLTGRLVNIVVRGVVAILTAIGGVVVLSVLLDALAKV